MGRPFLSVRCVLSAMAHFHRPRIKVMCLLTVPGESLALRGR